MPNQCDDCKANPVDIARKTEGTPTAKLIAVLQDSGVSSTKELAALCGISERAVQRSLQGSERQARPWFKCHVSMLNDHKVQTLSPDVFKVWVNHQCVCAEYPNSTISDADMAWRLRLSVPQWGDHKAVLVAADLVTHDNRAVYIPLEGECERPPAGEWAEIRRRIFARDDYTCRYCGDRAESLECDHVVPVSRGGGHDDENLVTACRPCNRSKRDKIVSIEDWSSKRRAVK